MSVTSTTETTTIQELKTTPIPTVDELLKRKREILIEEQLVIEKAMSSQDVDQIMKAQDFIQKKNQNTEGKSMIIDPMTLQSGLGYKEKPFSISYDILRNMGKTHIIKAIRETRIEQISAFCTPQKDKYSTGFVIQKKEKWRAGAKETKLTKAEEETINDIVEFILNCGNVDNKWKHDTFPVFVGKLMNDALTYDQGTFECVRNRKGDLIQFFATDGATYRLADSYNEDEGKQNPKELQNGHTPDYVQIYQNCILAEFYPWDLGWCIRNPQTDIRLNGYGRSELEDMVQTVTGILNSDFYNANFFKVGSAPKGILKYSGNINQNTVDDFRRQWVAQVSGVNNMHKIPLINADKLDFINTLTNNKDMEFSKYQEFLIKISCALYKIDPSEIGFPMSGSSESKPMFEGSQEARLEYSKDKGLVPLLKHLEGWINKWVVSELTDKYEFRFVGYEGNAEESTDLDEDVKRLSNFMTVNEIRAKWNLPKIKEGGDTILNPTLQNAINAAQMNAQQGNQGANQMMGGQGGDEGEENPFTSGGQDQEQQGGDEENPFLKSIQTDLERLLS